MPALKLRTYQLPVFLFRGKFLLVEFARQTGKSFTLANWAVARMLERLSKNQSWLIVVISNSRANGVEFGQKISDVLTTVKEVDSFLREEPDAVTDGDAKPLAATPSKSRTSSSGWSCGSATDEGASLFWLPVRGRLADSPVT
jgi:hypothetical protein